MVIAGSIATFDCVGFAGLSAPPQIYLVRPVMFRRVEFGANLRAKKRCASCQQTDCRHGLWATLGSPLVRPRLWATLGSPLVRPDFAGCRVPAGRPYRTARQRLLG
jgi:hypothetical protein